MKQYLDLLQDILDNGNDRGSRAGGTRGVFGRQLRFNLAEGFPLLTTKKMAWRSIVYELLWMLKGDTNIKYLLENDVHIWTADAYRVYKAKMNDSGLPILDMQEFEYGILTDIEFGKAFGDLGPVYGKQWRQWEGYVYENNYWQPKTIDQISMVIESIKRDPDGRRHIVTAWNPAELASMALPPCHLLFQFYVNAGALSCQLYQRSADVFLGVPFNMASYALLTHIIAHQCGLKVGEFVHTFGDVHIYNNHMDAVKEQLSREPLELPTLLVRDRDQKIDTYDYADFEVLGYRSHGLIKAPLSVGV